MCVYIYIYIYTCIYIYIYIYIYKIHTHTPLSNLASSWRPPNKSWVSAWEAAVRAPLSDAHSTSSCPLRFIWVMRPISLLRLSLLRFVDSKLPGKSLRTLGVRLSG